MRCTMTAIYDTSKATSLLWAYTADTPLTEREGCTPLPANTPSISALRFGYALNVRAECHVSSR